MKKFLFYFLTSILLLAHAANAQNQQTQQNDIDKTLTLINQAKYDEALRLISSVKTPSDKEERVLYYLTKVKALESTPYRANKLVESETDPTKFTYEQKQNAIKQSYKELWNLRSTLINMPYQENKKYLGWNYYEIEPDTLYDALVNTFINRQTETNTKVLEESYKLGGKNREGIREYWHIQYILTEIAKRNIAKSTNFDKENSAKLAQFFAVIAGKGKDYESQFKKYFFEAKTKRGKYEAYLQSANFYQQAEQFDKAHEIAEDCSVFEIKNNACVNLKTNLERPSAYVTDSVPKNYKPNTALPIKFKANNLKQITFKLYKISLKQMQEGVRDFKDLKPYKTYPQNLTYDKPYTPKDFDFELPALERGFYSLTLNYEGENYPSSYNINITDLALVATSYLNTDNLQTLNYKDTSVNFYTLSAHNGQPLAASISAEKLNAVQTKQDGQANIKTTQNLRNVVAKYQNNYALINYLYPQYYNKPNPISIYINTDRSIYKPGEDVQIVVNAAENKDNKYFTYQGQEKLNIAIRNASYKEVAKDTITLDSFGQAVYTFKVPQDTMLGNFSINATLGMGRGYGSFQVEEFKQPEFTLNLSVPDTTYAFNNPVTINGKASYYSGEALANAKVVFTINKQRFYPCCYRWNNFDFEDEAPVYIETITDKNGDFKVTFKPKSKKEKNVLPARYLIKAEVTGTNGHTISGETNLYVANQKYFFSIENPKGFFLNDTENILILKMQNAAGKPQKGKAVFEIFEAKLKDSKNLYYYQENFDLAKEPVFSTELEFIGNEISQKLPILKEGFYGAKLKAYGDESEVFIFPIYDSKKPSLEAEGSIALAENKKYIVGENAKILLGASKAKGPKFVEIYKNGFFVKRLKLSNQPLQILTLPISPEYQGGISLRWLGVYDYESFGNTLNIEVPYLSKDAEVKLNVPENLEPGQKAEINLSATIDGKPLQNARAIFTVYDKALDYYKPHNFNLPQFYRQNFGSGNISNSLQSSGGIYYANASFGSIGRSSGMKSLSMARSANSMDMAFMEESAAPMLAKNAMSQDTAVMESGENNAVRSDFAPTAYFNPRADLKNGKTAFNFKMPDSLTEWTAAAIVFSKILQTGKTQVNFKTSKDLTLRLETPTFLRQDDKIVIKTLLKNNTKQTLQGEVSLTLNVNGKTAENAFNPQQVSLKPNEEKTLTWPYTAPKVLGEITLTAAICSGQIIDGETRTLPLLTSMQYLPNSKTIVLKEGGNSLQLAPIKEGEILSAAHLTLDTSLLVPVVSAMPLLAEQTFKTATSTIDRYLPLAIINELYAKYPDFKKAAKQIERKTKTEVWNKQTSEILLKDTELSPWYNLSKGGCEGNFINIFDAATIAKKQKNYEADLKKYQNSDGGFAWIKGGKSSLYVTLYVVDRLAQASYFGVKPPMAVTQNALKYLHNQYKKFDFSKPYYPFEAIYYAYVISAFDKTLLVQGTRTEVQTLADYIDGQKEILAPLGQVYMAVIYNRLGNTQKAKKYINMLFETAKENDITGTSFAMEERSWQWFKDDLTLHAEALRMLLEVEPNSPRIDGLIKWIIFNKKATMWGSTTSAAKAVYSLLDAIKTWGVLNQNKHYNIAWNGENYSLDFGPLAKENKTVFSVYAPQANNESLKAEIMQNTTNAQGKKAQKTLPSFATLSNLVISNLPQEASPKGVLNITKAYYLIKENTVRPLRENETIKVGDKIEVRLTIKAEHNFDFVMIQDKKPAAFDTENLLSGWVWDGLSRYEDLQLAQTNFFMDYVPVGTYELKYVLRPTAEGVFNVGSSIMQSMFAPEVSAHSNSFIIKVEK